MLEADPSGTSSQPLWAEEVEEELPAISDVFGNGASGGEE